MKKLKVGDRVESTYRTAEGHWQGTVVEVFTRECPDWALRVRATIKWDHGRVETLNQNRFSKK